MTGRDPAPEFTVEEMGAIERFLISCTVPLIYQNAKGTGVLGTGTLFQVGGRNYLITAGHLFDGIDPENIGIPERYENGAHIVTLGHCTIFHPKDTDNYDVAVIELLEADVCRLVKSGWHRLTMANVAAYDPTTTDYILAGYPDETVVYDNGALKADSLLQLYTGPYKEEVVGGVGEFDFCLRYGRQLTNAFGVMKDSPDLGGASGASVYAFTPATSSIWSPEGVLRIVGIQVAMPDKRRYIRAKKWSLVEHVLKLAMNPPPK